MEKNVRMCRSRGEQHGFLGVTLDQRLLHQIASPLNGSPGRLESLRIRVVRKRGNVSGPLHPFKQFGRLRPYEPLGRFIKAFDLLLRLIVNREDGPDRSENRRSWRWNHECHERSVVEPDLRGEGERDTTPQPLRRRKEKPFFDSDVPQQTCTELGECLLVDASGVRARLVQERIKSPVVVRKKCVDRSGQVNPFPARYPLSFTRPCSMAYRTRWATS